VEPATMPFSQEEMIQFRRNHHVPVPEPGRVEPAAGGLKDEENHVIEGRAQRIGAAMLTEREHLLPLAPKAST
jgi:hypothetical protein